MRGQQALLQSLGEAVDIQRNPENSLVTKRLEAFDGMSELSPLSQSTSMTPAKDTTTSASEPFFHKFVEDQQTPSDIEIEGFPSPICKPCPNFSVGHFPRLSYFMIWM